MTTGQMLNKKLCIKCYNEHRTLRWETLPSKERMWSKGFVVCVWVMDTPLMKRKQKSSYVKVSEEPPPECYYCLEHLMTMQGRKHNG